MQGGNKLRHPIVGNSNQNWHGKCYFYKGVKFYYSETRFYLFANKHLLRFKSIA